VTREALAAFSAVFSVADPLGLVPVYLAMTREYSPAQRHRTALLASAAMCVTLTVFAAAGQTILHFFGLSIGAFRIAGGSLLFLMAVDMLRAQPSRPRTTPEESAEGTARAGSADIAIFPLAFPMLAGPGAIANAMMQMAGARTAGERATIYLAIILASAATAVVLLVGARAEKRLGKTGLNVLERVMGLLLAAIAVQFIVDGIGDVLPALRQTLSTPGRSQ
jgi:multiple antibiotic resistance protein